jgi:predicted RNase H-like nuclease (RuvC/YqgF family)
LELQEEYAELKAQEQRTGKKMSEIEAQNKTLSKPLADASAAVAELKHKLQHYEKVTSGISIPGTFV